MAVSVLACGLEGSRSQLRDLGGRRRRNAAVRLVTCESDTYRNQPRDGDDDDQGRSDSTAAKRRPAAGAMSLGLFAHQF
jgi:hypothetical protein